MIVSVNGQERQLPDGTSLSELLSSLDIPRAGTAVELNREVVPRRLHEETALKNGDRIEIIRMVGGG